MNDLEFATLHLNDLQYHKNELSHSKLTFSLYPTEKKNNSESTSQCEPYVILLSSTLVQLNCIYAMFVNLTKTNVCDAVYNQGWRIRILPWNAKCFATGWDKQNYWTDEAIEYSDSNSNNTSSTIQEKQLQVQCYTTNFTHSSTTALWTAFAVIIYKPMLNDKITQEIFSQSITKKSYIFHIHKKATLKLMCKNVNSLMLHENDITNNDNQRALNIRTILLQDGYLPDVTSRLYHQISLFDSHKKHNVAPISTLDFLMSGCFSLDAKVNTTNHNVNVETPAIISFTAIQLKYLYNQLQNFAVSPPQHYDFIVLCFLSSKNDIYMDTLLPLFLDFVKKAYNIQKSHYCYKIANRNNSQQSSQSLLLCIPASAVAILLRNPSLFSNKQNMFSFVKSCEETVMSANYNIYDVCSNKNLDPSTRFMNTLVSSNISILTIPTIHIISTLEEASSSISTNKRVQQLYDQLRVWITQIVNYKSCHVHIHIINQIKSLWTIDNTASLKQFVQDNYGFVTFHNVYTKSSVIADNFRFDLNEWLRTYNNNEDSIYSVSATCFIEMDRLSFHSDEVRYILDKSLLHLSCFQSSTNSSLPVNVTVMLLPKSSKILYWFRSTILKHPKFDLQIFMKQQQQQTGVNIDADKRVMMIEQEDGDQMCIHVLGDQYVLYIK